MLLVAALAAACAEREARTLTSHTASSSLPPIDRETPADTRTASFALG